MTFTFQEISYTKVGRGPHLCFLHGFCENSSIWNLLIETLSESYTCIAIDLPGFGKSSNLSFGSVPDVSHSIYALLRNEAAINTIIFGHSLGGYILAEYISSFPKDLRGAAFVHSTARGDSPQKQVNRDKSIDFISKYGTDEFFKLFVPSLVSSENLELLHGSLDDMVKSTSKKSVLEGLMAMKTRKDNWNSLGKFVRPILFVKGSEDKHYPDHEVFEQAAECSLAQVSVLPEVGHLSMLENPEGCLSEVLRFLDFVNRVK